MKFSRMLSFLLVLCLFTGLASAVAEEEKITLRDTEGYMVVDEDGAVQVLWQINGSDAWVGIGYIINGPAETLLQVVESLSVS